MMPSTGTTAVCSTATVSTTTDRPATNRPGRTSAPRPERSASVSTTSPLRSLAHLRFSRLWTEVQKRFQSSVRKRGRAVSVAADHVGVDNERVEHRFLHGLDDRGVEVVHPAPRYEREHAE